MHRKVNPYHYSDIILHIECKTRNPTSVTKQAEQQREAKVKQAEKERENIIRMILFLSSPRARTSPNTLRAFHTLFNGQTGEGLFPQWGAAIEKTPLPTNISIWLLYGVHCHSELGGKLSASARLKREKGQLGAFRGVRIFRGGARAHARLA